MVDGGHILSTAYECVVDLLTNHPDMTALFASNDESAIAAMAAIHDLGLNVPHDVAIASVDDTEFARMVRPALTTVSVPRQEMVDNALHFLMSHRDHPVSPPASLILPLELIVRESSGAKRSV